MFYENLEKKLNRGKRVRIDLTSNRYSFLEKNKRSNQTYENGEHCLYIFKRKLQTKTCE